MESIKYLQEITNLEQQLNKGIDLLEIAKVYCEFNYDKSDEISAVNSVLEIVLQIQKSIAQNLEKLLAE